MGSWNQTCAVTGNSIFDGEEVVGMWLLGNRPLPFYIRGKYDDYGRIGNEHGPMLEDAMAFFKKYLHEMDSGENEYHDIPVKKDNLNFDLLMEADHEERLFLCYERFRFVGVPNPKELLHIQIKADVFEDLSKFEIKRYDGEIFNVNHYKHLFQGYLDSVRETNEDDIKAIMALHNYELRSIFSDSYGERLSPNTYMFNIFGDHFLSEWDVNDPNIMDKFTNIAETFMVCVFLQHAGRSLNRPSHTGQEDNCDVVDMLANITLKASQKTRSKFDED